MYNILVIYHYNSHKKTNTLDHLYSFKKYSGCRCFYLNLSIPQPIGLLKTIKFDLIIFHTPFFWYWNFKKLSKVVDFLKDTETIKIALPQDEYLQTESLCDLINEFRIDYIYSVSPASEWSKIYHKIDHNKTKIFEVLTGYLEPETLQRISNLEEKETIRNIDIGYRAFKNEYWLGRHGYLKILIAEIFKNKAPEYNLNVDISNKEKDTFFGDDWYRFLLRCKYTIGVEGGTSLLDRDGTIREKINTYTKKHPQATFAEVEKECFLGIDGNIKLFALSPRHLEACATKTCQVLIEGKYNGVLIPNQHYIELKRDFSNLDAVLKLIQEDHLRKEITERAYQDIVQSNKYTYQNFVKFVLEQSLRGVPENNSNKQIWIKIVWYWLKLSEFLGWKKAAFRSFMVSLLPVSLKLKLKKIIRGTK